LSKALLQEAAKASHKNVSEFILEAGIVAANQALAERRLFLLDEARWNEFQEALDCRRRRELPVSGPCLSTRCMNKPRDSMSMQGSAPLQSDL
jgi:hypothetical protein